MKNPFIYFLLFLLFFSCKKENVDGIIIRDTLRIHQSYQENKQLQKLIKGALNKDVDAWTELINFPNGGGASGYDLGYVHTQIIHRIGEEEFIEVLKRLPKDDRNQLLGYIFVGCQYGDNDYDGKMDYLITAKVFPKINQFNIDQQAAEHYKLHYLNGLTINDFIQNPNCKLTCNITTNNAKTFKSDDYSKDLNVELFNNSDSIYFIPKSLYPTNPIRGKLEFLFYIEYFKNEKWQLYAKRLKDVDYIYQEIEREYLPPNKKLQYKKPLEVPLGLEKNKYRTKAIFIIDELKECKYIVSDWYYFEVE